MSKGVLIATHPKYCELIASGKKTVEVRTSKPKIHTPFKVYLYQTKKHWIYKLLEKLSLHQGKVIGEFVCDSIDAVYPFERAKGVFLNTFTDTCLSADEYIEYSCGKTTFFWHISDLVIYDNPKGLDDFRKSMECHRGTARENCIGCWDCEITRPPQSWCYVEELGAE